MTKSKLLLIPFFIHGQLAMPSHLSLKGSVVTSSTAADLSQTRNTIVQTANSHSGAATGGCEEAFQTNFI